MMHPAELATLLLWCAAAHYAILLLSFLLFASRRDAFYRLHTHWFGISRERYDTIGFACLAAYKLAIWLFFLVPGLVLLALG